MWFLFVLPPLVAAASATILKTTGAGKLVTAGIFVMGWQVTRGYRAGEGQLTDRANGGKYWGISPDLDSDYDLNQGLGLLAAMMGKEFEPYIGKKFDMTESEGEQLRAMVIPAVDAAQQAHQAMLYAQRRNMPDAPRIAAELLKEMKKVAHPVVVFLRQFPKKRVKDGEKQAG